MWLVYSKITRLIVYANTMIHAKYDWPTVIPAKKFFFLVILTETGAAGLIFFTEYNGFCSNTDKKGPDFSKFTFIFELQPLQEHIYP